MAATYRNSLIPLAATGSAGCHEGLFPQHEPREVRITSASSHKNEERIVVVRPRIKHWSDTYTDDVPTSSIQSFLYFVELGPIKNA